METPFLIGGVYYKPVTMPYQMEQPCPVCYGNKKVEVVLGNGDRVEVECEGCGLGYEGPRGVVKEYVYEAMVYEFEVDSIHSMYEGRWTLKDRKGHLADWHELCSTEDEARAKSLAAMKEVETHNNVAAINSKKARAKHMTWTVRYHEKCIKDYEKKIEWHRSKVSERKGK